MPESVDAISVPMRSWPRAREQAPFLGGRPDPFAGRDTLSDMMARPWSECHLRHLKVMRFTMLIIAVLLGALVTSPTHADGEGPPSFRDRPQVGQPVRFTDAAGHVFQPERLVIVTPHGAQAAPLPATTRSTRSEEHLDLSGLPLIGHVFRRRLAPGDARQRGVQVGPLSRMGESLVLDARESPVAIDSREIILTANFPRDGAVSYRLGALRFAPVSEPGEVVGRPAGTAWLVGEVLVLAGPGYGPGIENLEAVIGELLR